MTGLVDRAPRYVFFTGKGGVGKTSVACATALELAAKGRRVLLVSTDPASNLDEVLETPLGNAPTAVAGVECLSALNVDPEAAAAAYRENVVGPYRGVLPDAAVRSIEEQLSGACTVEIAAFDEFANLIGDSTTTADFDHVLFDTAPTGHTLRLLALPAAWSDYLDASAGGTSCIGPLAGLKAKRALYRQSRDALCDGARTRVVLVSRPDEVALREAERTRAELSALGVCSQELVLNGVFQAAARTDPVARAFEERGNAALLGLPPGLASLPRTVLPLLAHGLVGCDHVRALFGAATSASDRVEQESPSPTLRALDLLLPELARPGRGVVMTMGKGGVGKTSIAKTVARALADAGHPVRLATTDPAADPSDDAGTDPRIRVSRIDPEAETRAYVVEAMRTAGATLDEAGRALLAEDLSSPCTEEVAVFHAFARLVDEAERGFVVIDTAPTGHTLLLLDAAEAYHREVARTSGHAPEAVRRLLPRLRDPEFTRVLLVTLPEATPVHEARALGRDLERAQIRPFAWVVNQSLTPLTLTDPGLSAKQASEGRYLREVEQLGERIAVVPWAVTPDPSIVSLPRPAVVERRLE